MKSQQVLKNQAPTIPIRYKPFDKQSRFHYGRRFYKYRFVFTGTGAGKTWAGLAEAIALTQLRPGSRTLISEPTYGMVDRILLKSTIPDILGVQLEEHPLVKKFDRSKYIVDWKNGSQWFLVGLDNPERAEGLAVDTIWADEFRLIGGSGPSAPAKQEVAWQVLTRRARGSPYGRYVGYPVLIYITTTTDAPGSTLHTIAENPSTRMENSKIYRWSLFDNPTLTQIYKRDTAKIHIPGSGLYNRFILGLFAAVAIGSFAYDSTIHEFSTYPSKGWFRQFIYGIDWGWTNPACILAIGIDYDGRAYILEEVYVRNVGNDYLIREAKGMVERWGPGPVYCGTDEPKSIDEFKRAGLRAMKEEGKRADGIRELGSRFIVKGDGKPRIYVHSSCVNFISEVVIYDETKKVNDHAIDTARYALMTFSLKSQKPAWVLR